MIFRKRFKEDTLEKRLDKILQENNDELREEDAYFYLKEMHKEKIFSIKEYNHIINKMTYHINFKNLLIKYEDCKLYLNNVSIDNWKIIDKQNNDFDIGNNYIKIKKEILNYSYTAKNIYSLLYFFISFLLKDHFEIKNRLAIFSLCLIFFYFLVCVLLNIFEIYFSENLIDFNDLKKYMGNFLYEDGITFLCYFLQYVSHSMILSMIKELPLNKKDIIPILIIFVIAIFFIVVFFLAKKEILILILSLLLYYTLSRDDNIYKLTYFFLILAGVDFIKIFINLKNNRYLLDDLIPLFISSLCAILFYLKLPYELLFICEICSLVSIFYLLDKEIMSNNYKLFNFVGKSAASTLTLIFTINFISEKGFILVKHIYNTLI